MTIKQRIELSFVSALDTTHDKVNRLNEHLKGQPLAIYASVIAVAVVVGINRADMKENSSRLDNLENS